MLNKDELNQLYRYALSLSAHEETAYDLVQGAVERYLKKSSTTIKQPRAYLKTTIRNLYFDLERHRKVVPMIPIESDEVSEVETRDSLDHDTMEDLLINQQEVQRLIACLTSEENELLYLWAVEEHTVEEIAAIYEKPKGTMLSKLHRLKKRIREQLHSGDKVNSEENESNKGVIQ